MVWALDTPRLTDLDVVVTRVRERCVEVLKRWFPVFFMKASTMRKDERQCVRVSRAMLGMPVAFSCDLQLRHVDVSKSCNG